MRKGSIDRKSRRKGGSTRKRWLSVVMEDETTMILKRVKKLQSQVTLHEFWFRTQGVGCARSVTTCVFEPRALGVGVGIWSHVRLSERKGEGVSMTHTAPIFEPPKLSLSPICCYTWYVWIVPSFCKVLLSSSR